MIQDDREKWVHTITGNLRMVGYEDKMIIGDEDNYRQRLEAADYKLIEEPKEEEPQIKKIKKNVKGRSK